MYFESIHILLLICYYFIKLKGCTLKYKHAIFQRSHNKLARKFQSVLHTRKLSCHLKHLHIHKITSFILGV